jgi:hypothetical protein
MNWTFTHAKHPSLPADLVLFLALLPGDKTQARAKGTADLPPATGNLRPGRMLIRFYIEGQKFSKWSVLPGPAKIVCGNAIPYINPHTTFFLRPEIQMSSEEGLLRMLT